MVFAVVATVGALAFGKVKYNRIDLPCLAHLLSMLASGALYMIGRP
jgi:hypothetical protein